MQVDGIRRERRAGKSEAFAISIRESNQVDRELPSHAVERPPHRERAPHPGNRNEASELPVSRFDALERAHPHPAIPEFCGRAVALGDYENMIAQIGDAMRESIRMGADASAGG